MDFFSTITEVHPTLEDSIGVQSKSISNNSLSNLAKTVETLQEDKKKRLQNGSCHHLPVMLRVGQLMVVRRINMRVVGGARAVVVRSNRGRCGP
ncbi:65-kDa microtubule-associated protein 1 [Platanthera guangdongensis]|uniref:65-kDa microtubule-associated protein 1 n=1 Tax=Platanthera guangdongensis TaxID=2320717 RepID=A0ABR2MEZ6_9ASPA